MMKIQPLRLQVINARPINSSRESVLLPSSTEESHATVKTKTPAALLLEEINKAEQQRFSTSKQVLTFGEFLEEVVKTPPKYLRPSSQYVVDCIDYWNKVSGIDENIKIKVLGHEVRPFAFSKKPWEPKEMVEKTGVCGHELVLNDLYNILKINAQKQHPDRMILIHGPNATGKSIIVETLFEALEHYSQTDEGALYTFNWVFNNDDDKYSDFDLCFPAHSGKNAIQPTSENIRKENENAVTIPANLNTNPIFLLDRENRIKLLKLIEETGNLPSDFNKDYIISGNLDSSSKKIFDALWKLYDGKINKILKHVQVVRWQLSEQSHHGLVVIPPEESPEAKLIPITPEIDWDSLPKKIREAFRAAGLHELIGTFPQANRGHIYYDNMMKSGDIGRYLFLLGTAEKGEITISSGHGSRAADEKLDVVIWGTTNDVNINKLQREYDDWETLKERLTLTPVGYERRYRSIANIFNDQLAQMIPKENGRHISPHVLEMFALWTTMTYLFPPVNEKYYEAVDQDTTKPLKTLVKKLNMLQKALLYQEEDINSYELDPKKQEFSAEQQKLLRRYLKEIADEYNLGVGKNKFLFYEGGSGLSIRDARVILDDAIKAKPNECFSILEAFDTLEEWIKDGMDFEDERKAHAEGVKKGIEQLQKAKAIIAIPSVPDFNSQSHSPRNLLEQVKGHSIRQIKYEVQDALGFIKSQEEHTNNLRKYIEHIKAFRAKGIVSQQWRDPENSNQPNENFMRQMEKIFNPYEFPDITVNYKREEYRKEIVEKLGIWSAEEKHRSEDTMANLDKIFPDLLEKLKDKDITDNKEKLYDFLYDSKVYFSRKDAFERENITEKMKERIKLLHKGLAGLKEKGYCEKCMPKILDFAFSDEEYRKAIASGRKTK